MDEKTYKNLLEIQEYLTKDNERIDSKLETLYIKKSNIKTIINKIYSIEKSDKLVNEKTEGIILTSLLTTIAIFYEIITIATDNGITKNNLPIVSITPFISYSLSHISFIGYKKDKKFLKENNLNKLKDNLMDTEIKINNLIDRKITNQKILNNIEKNLSINNSKKLVKKKIN